MNYIELKDLQEILKNEPKETVVAIIHDYVKFNSIDTLQRKIIHIKININLAKQKKVLDEIDSVDLLTKDKIKWFENVDKNNRLNNELQKLDKEWNKLYKSLDEVK